MDKQKNTNDFEIIIENKISMGYFNGLLNIGKKFLHK